MKILLILHLSHTAFEVLDKGGSCCRAPARAATFQVNAKCKSLFIHFASRGLTISCRRGWISLLEVSTGRPRSSTVVSHANSGRDRNLVRYIQFVWQYWNKEKRSEFCVFNSFKYLEQNHSKHIIANFYIELVY